MSLHVKFKAIFILLIFGMISEMGVGGGFAVRTSAHNKHMIQMALVYSYIDLLFSFSFELN